MKSDKSIRESQYRVIADVELTKAEIKQIKMNVTFAHTLRCHIWLYILYNDEEITADISNNRKYDETHEIAFLQGWLTGYFNRQNQKLLKTTIEKV